VRRAATALLCVSLLAAACSGGGSAGTTTTTLPPPTTAGTTTTEAAATTTSSAPTTTVFVPEVRVRIDGDEEASEAVTALFATFADPGAPPPDVPAGLLEHTAAASITENSVYDGEIHSAELEAGRVGVVTMGDDIVLLADDGDGWRVVGAKLPRFGLGPWYGDPVRHILVIGTDARVGQSQTQFRADSIHILSSNIAEASGSILGFPRDTYVQASYGNDKFTNVNATSDRHGAEMVDIAADMSGVPIDGYIITGFLGFQGLVNDFGGVVVNIPFAMADQKSKAYFSAGVRLLWGKDALAFSRNRHITGGDFTRSFHQGVVMHAALEKVQEADLTMLPALLAMLDEFTWTDLTMEELITVAAGAFEMDSETVGNIVLPGTVDLIGGASVVVLDEEGAETLFRDIDDGMFSVE
jgi:LCP family protein required for cell wall assembly